MAQGAQALPGASPFQHHMGLCFLQRCQIRSIETELQEAFPHALRLPGTEAPRCWLTNFRLLICSEIEHIFSVGSGLVPALLSA